MKAIRLVKRVLILGCGLALLLTNSVLAHDVGNAATSSKFSYAAAVKLAQPSVVNLYVLKPKTTSSKKSRLGSGVIISKQGYVLTNNHVVRNAIKVYVVLSDGRRALAKVVGTDPDTDLAVLKIKLTHLHAIPMGKFSDVHVGDVVLAIGNPFGLGQTVTQGIVSALGRSKVGINQLETYIQTDAAINPGNSGGALINTHGQLIGINTGIYSRSGGYQGVGFAIPVNVAMNVMSQVVKNGYVKRGWLGVKVATMTSKVARSLRIKRLQGVLVTAVTARSPASQSGIKRKDIITSIDNHRIASSREFQAYIALSKPGTVVNLTAVRGSTTKKFTLKIATRPAAERRRSGRVLILPDMDHIKRKTSG